MRDNSFILVRARSWVCEFCNECEQHPSRARCVRRERTRRAAVHRGASGAHSVPPLAAAMTAAAEVQTAAEMQTRD
jgi:hypothetical protein